MSKIIPKNFFALMIKYWVLPVPYLFIVCASVNHPFNDSPFAESFFVFHFIGIVIGYFLWIDLSKKDFSIINGIFILTAFCAGTFVQVLVISFLINDHTGFFASLMFIILLFTIVYSIGFIVLKIIMNKIEKRLESNLFRNHTTAVNTIIFVIIEISLAVYAFYLIYNADM